MPVFPSVEWFQAVADLVNHDEEYRKLGYCDANMGVRVGDRVFAIMFEGFEVTSVKEIPDESAEDLDFTLVMPPEKWREMLESIKEHGRGELDYTLNTIDLATPEEFARASDESRRDLFFRFNQSFQHYFDSSAKIDTKFELPAGAA